jgi:hypothetical protein
VTDPTLPAAGWYPDPSGAPTLRWWNGVTWSEATHPLMPVTLEPLAVPPTAPVAAAQVWSPVMPPEPQPATEAPQRRHRRWVPVVAAVALVALAVTAVSALLGGAPRLDTHAIEASIAADLSAGAGHAVRVDCPADVRIDVGSTFTCTASDSGGEATMVVEQLSEGGDVRWAPQR